MNNIHGGDRYAASQCYSGALLDFSVNLNPLGPPPSVLEAVQAGLDRVEEYPDPDCRALRQALSRREGVPAEQILCGNGASELIYRLVYALRPKVALLTAPTFSEYENALDAVGCETHHYLLNQTNRFDLTADFLAQLTPEVELVFLCTPNNPTGRLIDEGLLEQIACRCGEIGAILAVDECFLPLSQRPDGMESKLAELPNLVLLRAFTKSYAIPALRLGYVLSANTALLQRMEKAGPCWNVSLPAQLAGIACCQESFWPEEGRKLIQLAQPELEGGLAALGLEVIPSHTGFVLFRDPGNTKLKEDLLQQGILIRSCASFLHLGEDWYRVAIRKPEENRRLLSALAQIKGGGPWQR
jgi:threonine-phosphate decarboxylase